MAVKWTWSVAVAVILVALVAGEDGVTDKGGDEILRVSSAAPGGAEAEGGDGARPRPALEGQELKSGGEDPNVKEYLKVFFTTFAATLVFAGILLALGYGVYLAALRFIEWRQSGEGAVEYVSLIIAS